VAETLAEHSVVHGGGCDRRQAADRPAAQTLQIDFLSKVLPNYHHLKKPTKKAAQATS
jgi:dynactin-6